MNGTQFHVLGCRVDAVSLDEATAQVLASISDPNPEKTPIFVVTLGTEMAVRAGHDTRFRSALSHATLTLCDTIGILLTSRLRRGPLRERVTGVALAERLSSELATRGGSVFLLGSSKDTVSLAATALVDRYPGLSIAGTHDGFFAEGASDVIAASIARSGASLLLVALGSPKQELWLDRYLVQTRCAVGIGVGGAFDIFAGTVPRAPQLWQDSGFEWLYRLIKEPRRWRRQLALPLFVFLASGEALTGIFRRRTPRP